MSDFISRDEILSGLVGRRAQTLLFMIESRTARLMDQSRHLMDRFSPEEAYHEREMQFLDAFSQKKDPPLRPKIQDIEQYAPQWEKLLPDQPRVRAALAHLLKARYTFTIAEVPGIRDALGLDTQTLQDAYLSLYNEPISAIYTDHPGPLEWLRWAWAKFAGKLDNLPPFWSVFSLTLTETVGGGLLALPMAVAGIGPIPGIILIILFGLINISTIYFYSEAIIRNGSMRYGSPNLVRLVREYLGSGVTLLVSFGSLFILFMITWAYYLGFARTVYSLTSISPVIVLGFLFLAGVYMALRGGLSAAASTALVIGFTNIILLVIIIAIALPHMKPGNLSYVNIPSFSTILGQREILASILGVILMTYFGHMSVSVCSRMALEREPGGRSLQWGAMTAQFVAMILNVLWVLAVYGAVSRQAILDDIASTSLTPLSAEVGLLVKLLGSAFVILGMGMGAIRDPFYLSQLMLSFLPKRSKKTIILPRRRGQLILAGKKNQAPGQALTLTYLGLRDNLPLLRLDINTDGSGNTSATRHHEFTLDEKWSIESHEPGCANLKIEALQSSPANLSLTLETAYSVSYRGEWDNTGLAVASLLDMEGSQKNLLNWMIRKVEFRMRDLQEYLGQDEANAALALQLIQDEGWVGKLDNSADPLYQVYFSPGKKRRAPEAVWKALDGIDTPARSVAPAAKKASQTPPWLLSFFYSKVGAMVLSLLPGVIVLLFSLWSLVTPGVSFSIILGVAGIIVGALLTGIIPALLIAISRKKGDRTPGVVYGFLGNPVYLIAIFLFSWFNILAHGLIIWEGFFQRGIALLVCAFFAFMTYRLFRQGAFRTSFVIEVIMDTREDGPATISFFNGGVPAETSLRLETTAEVFEYRVSSLPLPDLATLRKLTVNIPAEAAGDLLVWARKINQDGNVESIPGRLEFEDGSATCSHDLAQAADRLQLHSRANCQVEIIPA